MDERYYEEKEYAQGRYANNVNIHNMETCDTLTEKQHLAIHYLRSTRHAMHVDGADAVFEGRDDWVIREVGGDSSSGVYESEINAMLREAGLSTIEFLTFDDCPDSSLLAEFPEYWFEEGEDYDAACFRWKNQIHEIIEENDNRIRDYLVAIDMEHGTTYAPARQGEDIQRVIALNLKEATDTAAPAATLEALSENKNIKVRRAVADNRNTPASILEALAKDEYEAVRCAVADNSHTPVATLEVLAEDEYFNVRHAVAYNRSTPAATLEVLAKDEAFNVRREVAKNPNTLVATLEALVKDEAFTVRWAVADNSHTPATALGVLAKDESFNVRREVAKNPNTPATALEALAKDKTWNVRMEVAENHNTPSEILETLAKDEDEAVRYAVSMNPNTPPKKLVISASDLKEAKDEKAMRDAKAPEQEQKKQKNHEQGLE